jgi:hypothetical protein
MGNFFEDVFVNPVKKVVEEVYRPVVKVAEEVYRPVEKVATEAVRETKDIVATEKRWLESDQFKVAAVVAGGALVGPVVLDTLPVILDKAEKIWTEIGKVLGREDQETVPVTQNKSTTPSSSSPVINLSIPPQSTGGIVLATPPAAEQPNTMLYIGLGILAIILFKGL